MEDDKAAPKKEPLRVAPEDWARRLAAVPVTRAMLNKLVMNFLCVEAYKDVAAAFQAETGTEPEVPLHTLAERTEVRVAIEGGEPQRALERVNDIDPSVLDTNPRLFFHLKQQQLLELIARGDVRGAVEFAQRELAPRAAENPSFLEEMERIMSLLAFPQPTQSPHGALLEPEQRLRVATEVNEALLQSQAQRKEPRLALLLKHLVFTDAQLAELGVAFPRIQDFAAAIGASSRPKRRDAQASGAALARRKAAGDMSDEGGSGSDEEEDGADARRRKQSA